MKKKRMRRQYYIYREIQLKYIRLTLLLMLLVCTVIAYTIYETSWGMLVKKLPIPPEIKANYSFFNTTLILRLLLLVPVIVVATIYLSHRVAGPVFHMEREIGKIAGGDLTRRIVLRKNDDLKKLAGEINEFIRQVDEHLSAIKADMFTLRRSIDKAGEEGVREEDIRPLLNEWGICLERIFQKLDYFKTSS